MIRVCRYKECNFEEWDYFVLKKAVNGTFLQTRKFLSYHPPERFVDDSLMIYDDKTLVAVVPGCEIDTSEGIQFVSHKGSTYGGILVSKDYYKADKVLSIVDIIDTYLSEHYDNSLLKITADIHSKTDSSLLQYALFYHGYSNYVELNTYVDLTNVTDDVSQGFDRNKKRNIKKCLEHNLTFRILNNNEEVESFYELLQINLSKYNLTPIHTLPELLDFKNARIPNNVKFCGVFDGEKMMAAGMLFVFDNVNVIHAQNLSADYTFKEYSAITFLYYKVIEMAKKDGYKALSWGISTEEQGKILNTGLIRNKESYGSDYQLNRTYYKDYRSQI